ncbi:MAG: prepilin-type N-terminal cleavage/methylation domain-containing protein [Trueperaceae bacterium]|nr:prepilin-type N-terminal cleavage/methylation domain-containing protein [Trueperaceae bacterium]
MAARSTRRDGLTLVEVVIALGMLALVAAAFASLQVTNLRFTRSALESRTAVALLAYEAGLRSLLPTDDTECAAAHWLPLGWTCVVTERCEFSPACEVIGHEIEISLPNARAFSAFITSNGRLETASFRPDSIRMPSVDGDAP